MALIETRSNQDILEISFSDPSSRNSFSLAAARELKSALSNVKNHKALVFSAKGRVFCSGGQLDDYARMEKASEGITVNDEIRSLITELASLPVPTVCAVTGDCFGGGLELLSSFDFVLSVPHALFALWQRKIGLSFGWGGGGRLEARVGLARLRTWSLTAELISAETALATGLIDEIGIEAQIHERALERARKLSALPKAPVQKLKSFSAESEVEAFNSLWWNPEHRSVLDKRKK